MSEPKSYRFEYNGEIYMIPVKPFERIANVISRVRQYFNIDGSIRLTCRSAVLHDDDSLQDLEINTRDDIIRIRVSSKETSPPRSSRNHLRLPLVNTGKRLSSFSVQNRSETSTPTLPSTPRTNRSHLLNTRALSTSEKTIRPLGQLPSTKRIYLKQKHQNNDTRTKSDEYKPDFITYDSSEDSDLESLISEPIINPHPVQPAITTTPSNSETELEVQILSLSNHYVLTIPDRTTVGRLKEILWQKIDPGIDRCRRETHILLLFTHRMHIFWNTNTEEQQIKDFLELNPSPPHFYLYALERRDFQSDELYTYESNVMKMFATCQTWWRPIYYSDCIPVPRSESMLLSCLYALRLFFNRHNGQLIMWQQAMHAQFFINLRQYLFPPAVLALKHALEGEIFWFEKHVIVDSLIKLLLSLCPNNVSKTQLFDCIPLLFCWILEQCHPASPFIDYFDHVNLINLGDFDQDYYTDPAIPYPVSDGQLLLREANSISTRFIRQLDLQSLTRHLKDPERYSGIQKCKVKEYCIYNPPRGTTRIIMKAIDRLTLERTKQLYKIMANKYPSFMLITREALRVDTKDRLILFEDLTIGLVFKCKHDRSRRPGRNVEHYYETFHPHRYEVGKKKFASPNDFCSMTNENLRQTSFADSLVSNISSESVENGYNHQQNIPTQQITVILLDVSRSMIENPIAPGSGDTRNIFDMSIAMLGILSDNIISGSYAHAFGLIHFGTSINTDVCPITRNRDQFEKSLSIEPKHEEWTSMYDAINEGISAIVRFERDPQNKIANDCRKLVICISDGIENRSKRKLEDLQRRCSEHQVVVDFISFLRPEQISKRDAPTVRSFQEFCRGTHGYVYENLPTTTIELGATFEQEAAVWIFERDSNTYGVIEKPKRKIPIQLKQKALHRIPTHHSASDQAPKQYSRVMRECKDIQQKGPKNLLVFICQHDLFFWKVILEGPVGTPYHNGHWLLYAQFDSYYPQQAPTVRFITPIYHVNISGDGKICHELFDRGWSNQTSMIEVFNTIIDLLKEPNFEDPISTEKAQLKRDKPDQYNEQAKRHTETHANKSIEQLKREFALDD